MAEEQSIVLEGEQAERFVAAAETLAARMGDLSKQAWLTIAEAAEYTRSSEKYIRTKIRNGQLVLCGERKASLISRVHLDEQIARRFPRLDVETTDEAAERVLKARPAADYIARPRRKPSNRPAKPLVFK